MVFAIGESARGNAGGTVNAGSAVNASGTMNARSIAKAGGAAHRRMKVALAMAMSALLTLGAFGLSGCSKTDNEIPQLKSAVVSSPTIIEDGVLHVGVNTNNSPLAGSSSGRIIGVDVDIAAALADELGLKVEVVDVGSDGAAAIQSGEVDVVLGVESGSSESGCWLSTQYLQTGVVLFQNAGSDDDAPQASSSVDVAAQVSSKSAWAVTNIFGDDALSAASDLASAFSSLSSGEVDYAASDAVIGYYAANRQGADVEVCALLESPTGYCAMVSESNTGLQAAIDDALSTIKGNGIIGVIESKWLGLEVDLSGISKVEADTSVSTNAGDADDGADGEDADNAADAEDGSSNASSASSASGSSSSSGSSGTGSSSSSNA